MNRKFWGNIGFGAVIVCVIAFAVTKISASSSVESLFLPEVKVSDSMAELLHSVELARSSVKIPQSGHIVNASFAIENRGEHDIKNISILCTLFNTTGKEQGRDKWIVFDTVKSQGFGIFTFSNKKFISNSVARSECQIVDLEVVKAPRFAVHRGLAGAAAGHGDAAQEAGQSSAH